MPSPDASTQLIYVCCLHDAHAVKHLLPRSMDSSRSNAKTYLGRVECAKLHLGSKMKVVRMASRSEIILANTSTFRLLCSSRCSDAKGMHVASPQFAFTSILTALRFSAI